MSETSRAEQIRCMFAAKRIAVVGASENPSKPGYRPVSFLARHDFQGEVYPVNPGLQTCQGMPCYPSLADLPVVPDLVGVVVPAPLVPGILREAGELGTRTAVVISAGFAEAGPQGARLQEEIQQIAREFDMLICGPNSVGIIESKSGLTLTFTEALTRGELVSGQIGLVSQSGAFGTVLYAQARERGIGIATYVSSGNEACVTLGDYVEALISEPTISAVGGYVEGLRDFDSLARAAATGHALNKPIVLLKAGRSPSAGRAAASHTGSLVGDGNAYRAAFAEHGILQAHDEQELLAIIDAIQKLRRPARGPRVAVVTTSGGAGVLLTDLLESEGLQLADISSDLKHQLRGVLPTFASVDNPIDVTGSFVTDPTGLHDVLCAVAQDPGVDVVIAYIGLAWSNQRQWADALEHGGATGAPMVVCAPLLDQELARDLRGRKVVVCDSTRLTVAVCDALVHWGLFAQTKPCAPVASPGLSPSTELPVGVVGEDAIKSLLAEVGLPVPRGRVFTSIEEGRAFAQSLGDRVVLKVDAPTLTHKSDVGGVAVGVKVADLATTWAKIEAAVATRAPHVAIKGIRVEEMVTGGIELVIGAVRSHPFGILLAVGSGGVDVELRNDLAYGIAPVTLAQAHHMIESLAMSPLLRGYRNRPAADVDTLAETLVRVSALVASLGDRLVELDLNPVLVHPYGRGVTILDAMAVIEPSPGSTCVTAKESQLQGISRTEQ